MLMPCIGKIPEDMMPPRQPPSPFALFCQKTDKPKLTSLEEANKHMSDSGERWKAMSDAEKEVCVLSSFLREARF